MLNIKEIVLKLQATDRFRLNVSELSAIEFAEALIAEIAKQNDPVAWWNGKETAFFEHETDGPVGEVKIPLYTIPPTAEQIANETAEAIAEYCRNQDHYCLATEIESGAWKEFKNV